MQTLNLRKCGFTTDVAQMLAKEAGGVRFSVEEVETDEGVDGRVKGNLF